MLLGRVIRESITAAALAALCFSVSGTNKANTENVTVPTLPTLGDNAAYTVVDSADQSNTGMSFIQYTIDEQTKEIISQTTKYININKTTYNNGADTLTYSWDDSTKKLTVTKSGSAVRTDNLEYIGNSASGDGGATFNSGSSAKITTLTGDFISNSTTQQGGVISNNYGTITTLTGDFISNSAGGTGGAIYNNNTIG